MDPAIEQIVIQQGTDWWWARAIAHDDGTLKNLTGWSGVINIYAGTTYTDPAISSDAAKISAGAATATLTLGLQGIERASTTLSGAHTAGNHTIAVASVTDMTEGDTITVVQTDVAILEATITSINGTTITLSTPLTDDTDTGAVVQAWDPRYMLGTILVHVDASVTAALTPWGAGRYDIDLTDPLGRETRYWQGASCVQEGTP